MTRSRNNENLPKKIIPKAKKQKCMRNTKIAPIKVIRSRNNENLPKKLIPKPKKQKCIRNIKNEKLPIRILFIQGPVKSRFNEIPYFKSK